MKRHNFHLSIDQVQRLKELAEKRDLRLSELIRRAIDAYLDGQATAPLAALPDEKKSAHGKAQKREYSLPFLLFYAAYPRKQAKDDAWKAWRVLQLDTEVKAVTASVEEHKTWQAWKEDAGRFIPYPATFLRSGRWKDEATGDEAPVPIPCAECNNRGNVMARHRHLLSFTDEHLLEEHFRASLSPEEAEQRFLSLGPWWRSQMRAREEEGS